MAFKFLGHGAMGGTLTIGDKVYSAGDMVPLSKEAVMKHQRAGLSFEGTEDLPDADTAIPPTPADNRPRDDRGAVVEPKK